MNILSTYRPAFCLFVGLAVCSGPLSGQDIVPLTDGLSSFICGATIAANGQDVFYTRSTAGRWGLYLSGPDRAAPELLVEREGSGPNWLQMSEDASRLILASFTEIFSVDVLSRKLTVLTDRYGAAREHLHRLVVEHSTRRVLFGNKDGIFFVSWDGGPVEQILSIEPLALDAHGSFLYFVPISTPTTIIQVDRRNGSRRQLLEPNRHNLGAPAIFVSPDNEFILVAGPENHRLDIETGKLEPIFQSMRLVSADRHRRSVLLQRIPSSLIAAPVILHEWYLADFDGTFRKLLVSTRHSYSIGMPWGISRDENAFVTIANLRLPDPTSQFGSQWLYRIASPSENFKLIDVAAQQRHEFPTPLADDAHVIFLSTLGGTGGPQFVRARRDGTHFRQLTNLPISVDFWGAGVTSSADGNVVSWVQSASSQTKRTLRVYRVEDRRLFDVAEIPSGHDGFTEIPVFRGSALDASGRRLVFATRLPVRSTDRPNRGAYVYVADIGDRDVQLRLLTEGWWYPDLSSDGQWIALHAPDFPVSSVRVMRADGTGAVDLGVGSRPRLSADGRWVAFLGDIRVNTQTQLREYASIVVARTDGSARTTYAAPGLTFLSVAINADGQVVAAVATAMTAGGAAEFLVVAYDAAGQQIARFPAPNLVWPLALDSSGKHAYFSRYRSEVPGAGLNIFVARLKRFTYWAGEIPSTAELSTGLALANVNDTSVEIALTAHTRAGSPLAASNVASQTVQSLQAREQTAALLPGFFGRGLSERVVTVEMTSSKAILPYFVVGGVDHMQGASASDLASADWMFPLHGGNFESSLIILVNPNPLPVAAQVRADDSSFLRTIDIPPFGTATLDPLRELSVRSPSASQPLLFVRASLPLRAELRLLGKSAGRTSSGSIPALEPDLASSLLILPHVLTSGGYSTRVWISNPRDDTTEVELQLLDLNGQLLPFRGNPQRLSIGGKRSLDVPLEFGPALVAGYLRITAVTPGGRVGAVALVSQESKHASLFVTEALRPVRRKIVFPHLAQNGSYLTGYAVVNPYDFPVRYSMEVFDQSGASRGRVFAWLAAYEKHAQLLTSVLSGEQAGGYFVLEADWPVAVTSVIGTRSGSAWANVPPL